MGMDVRTATGFCAAAVCAGVITVAPPAMAQPQDPAPAPQPPAQATSQDASADLQVPPNGVPHLSSPKNLPPGTTDAPQDPPEGNGVSYLREVWQEMQTRNLSMGDALMLIEQRPMDPNPVSPSGLPVGPQQPPPGGPPPLPGGPPPPPPAGPPPPGAPQ